MIEQLYLIPPPPAKPLTADQQHVLDALTLGPGTAYQVMHRLAGLGVRRKENCVSKRLSELGPGTDVIPGRGLIVQTGERRRGSSHRLQHVWRLA